MRLWRVFEMEELLNILKEIGIAVEAAKESVLTGDIANTLYNVDHAEIEIMRARNLTVSIFHHGEKS